MKTDGTETVYGEWQIRGYRDADAPVLSEICLRTGDAGKDATGLFSDESLLADIYLSPYLAFEPELARVLARGDRPLGYVVATRDSVGFIERYQREWLPRFTRRHPVSAAMSPREREVVERGRRPESDLGPDQDQFPAHLHINLLPEGQGQGWGRALIESLLRALESESVAGVQLSVGWRNRPAQAFYRRLGFVPLPSTPQDPYRLGLASNGYRKW